MSKAWVTLLAWAVVILIPIRILGLGFLPPDDALRHAAKALTGRSWPEILVLRPEATEDSHPGWHAILGAVHFLTGAQGVDLVFFAVAFLFILIAGLGLTRVHASAWMLTLVIAAVFAPTEIGRWLSGRPYIVSSAMVLYLAFRWAGSGAHEWREWPRLVALFTVIAWIHPSFYLFALPVAALVLARRLDAAAVLGSAVAVGAVVAGCLTGSPLRYLFQSLMHPIWSLGWPNSTLAVEFQPFSGAPLFMVSLIAVFAGLRRPAAVPAPLAVLIGLGWSLGFVSGRFWTDWGFPAALVWLALTLEHWLTRSEGEPALRRLGIAAAIVFFLATTADTGGRLSTSPSRPYRVLASPEKTKLLPDTNGILYALDMRVFYEIFFRKPDAPFRYVLGFEPGLMRQDDQQVMREAMRSGLVNPLDSWVAKMTTGDRLVLRNAGHAPELPGLTWEPLPEDVWVGRKIAR